MKRPFIVRDTARRKGRFISVTPRNTSLTVLSYGRIILDRKIKSVSANSKAREVAVVCLKGEGYILIDSTEYRLAPYDALYIPPKTTYHVRTETSVDLAESSAPSDSRGGAQFVSFESVKNDPSLHATIDEETCSREIFRLIDMNVKASRLLCGVTFGKAGNWTSWSPHEHARSKEEVYLYINMPSPTFGIQMIYRDLKKVDFIHPVFEDDAVVITGGYHPNVGMPGYGINYLWMIAALNPETDRDWTDVHFQEDFAERTKKQ